MIETFDIAGYCRISVDEELDRDNTSIENQKAIIEDFVKEKFPGSSLTFFEDRDRSGYTFEQREGYQKLRRGLLNHIYDILVVKDFSRFSRRNSKGLGELEDLRDAGIRIISIGDGIDFPNDDQWLNIQLRFLMNEMPVTDTSKKVRAVVNRRQKDGKWITAASYGYKVNARQEFEVVPTEAEVVRQIFELYIDGWGYKRIANYLTDEGIPTPRMSERERKEAEGKEYKRPVKQVWAIVTVQGILDNDFYIGTMRQSKYTRKKINGKDVKKDVDEQIVIENHHQAIISYRDFRIAQELRKSRSKSDYRGVKKYENTYTGFLVCGDCGSPMFSMSRPDLRDAYRCGTYHRQGLKGCTSHYIRVDVLDKLLKEYLRKVRETSADMIQILQNDIQKQDEDLAEKETAADNMEAVLEELQEELQIAKRQRVRDLLKRPQNEAIINRTYDEMEADIENRISSLEKQIELTKNRENTIIRVNRAAKTAIEVFDEILEKDKLDPKDLHLIIDKIYVYEDHVDIKLKDDIDSILRCGMLPEEAKEPETSEKSAETFNLGTKDSLNVTIVQETEKRPDKVFRANVICDGEGQKTVGADFDFEWSRQMVDSAMAAALAVRVLGDDLPGIGIVAARVAENGGTFLFGSLIPAEDGYYLLSFNALTDEWKAAVEAGMPSDALLPIWVDGFAGITAWCRSADNPRGSTLTQAFYIPGDQEVVLDYKDELYTPRSPWGIQEFFRDDSLAADLAEQKVAHIKPENIGNYVLSTKLGGTTLTPEEAYALLDMEPEQVKERVKTAADVLMLMLAGQYSDCHGDRNITIDGNIWHYNLNAFQVMQTRTTNCGSAANLANYLLEGDYEEIGFILHAYYIGDGGGHVYNYFKYQGKYYIVDFSSY